MRERRKKTRRPIPWAISVGIALLPGREGMTEEEAEREVRKLVRKLLPKTPADWGAAQPFEEYNEVVSRIIEEELQKN